MGSRVEGQEGETEWGDRDIEKDLGSGMCVCVHDGMYFI